MVLESVLIAVGTAVLAAVVFVLWDLFKTHSRRRSRASHYKRVSTSQPAQLPESPLVPGLGPERVEFIRMEAENAARMAFLFPPQEVASPYAEGTREHVLWTASFHLQTIELSEARDAAAMESPDGREVTDRTV